MKTQYAAKRLRAETLATIDQANTIIEDFQSQGYRMTLRQLYYQFVTRNWIANEERSYKKLASVVSDGRLAGLIDWAAIEDRGRQPALPSHYDSVEQLLQVVRHSANGYTLDKWRGQNCYVELWVEKQALAGVLEPLAERFHVALMVNKGYSSQSAMYAAAQRFIDGMSDGRVGHLFYLGDFDPSGEDMVRDISTRMAMFGVDDLHVEKVALTRAQIQKYKPPPNPAKLTDPRAERYVQEHGQSSWEVDSLDPPVLVKVISNAIEDVIDPIVLEELLAVEARERLALERALSKIRVRI